MALGREAKTDESDARLLAEMARMRRYLKPTLAASETFRPREALWMSRAALAWEQRVVPGNFARFMQEYAANECLTLKPMPRLALTFEPGATPSGLNMYNLVNVLSALYPRGSQEERPLDSMLPAVPR